MKYIIERIKISFLLVFSAMLILSSCNKAPDQVYGSAFVAPTGNSLAVTIAAIANDSLYYKLIIRGGMLATINSLPNTYTMFVPDNNAMRVFINAISGGAVPLASPDPVFVGFINANIPVANAAGIVSYNICPQAITTASIPSTFPNFQYPSILNPAPALSALLRLTTFPSTRNGNWVNNVPLSAVNTLSANGVIHTTAAVVAPPSRYLWDRVNTDADLTIFRAAFVRADSGVAPTASTSLIGALNNIGANLTVFAPSNAAFKAILSALTGGAIPVANYVSASGATNVGTTVTVTSTTGLVPGMGLTVTAGAGAFAANTVVVSVVNSTSFTVSATLTTPLSGGAVVTGNSEQAFISFLGSNSISTTTVKGIVVYHILGNRAFTNNLPTTATSYPTLLNGAVPTHPGVSLVCTFTGLNVTSATVKGIVNATASAIALNPTPDPGGTSDQHFLNGTLHKINQVLLPQ